MTEAGIVVIVKAPVINHIVLNLSVEPSDFLPVATARTGELKAALILSP